MTCSIVNYSKKKGQMQIQQMAFVLVALMIFIGMVAVGYLTIRISSLNKDVLAIKEKEAFESAKSIAKTAELIFEDCAGCVDSDKLLVLKERKSYKGFWNVDYIAVEKIYPESAKTECTRFNYPNCTTFTLVNKSSNFGIAKGVFVSLCRQEIISGSAFSRCELGKIYVGGGGA